MEKKEKFNKEKKVNEWKMTAEEVFKGACMINSN